MEFSFTPFFLPFTAQGNKEKVISISKEGSFYFVHFFAIFFLSSFFRFFGVVENLLCNTWNVELEKKMFSINEQHQDNITFHGLNISVGSWWRSANSLIIYTFWFVIQTPYKDVCFSYWSNCFELRDSLTVEFNWSSF